VKHVGKCQKEKVCWSEN